MNEASLLLMLITFQVAVLSATSLGLSMSLPGCPDKCGDVLIPYPFGIGHDCAAASMNRYFIVNCNRTFHPPRPTVGDRPVEIIDISLERGEMRLYGFISYNCFASKTTVTDHYNGQFLLKGTPFIPSTTRNRFTVIGCQTLGIIGGYTGSSPDLYLAGCYSYCQGISSTSDGAPCAGKGCCETTITPNLTSFVGLLPNQSSVWTFNPCFYAMLAEVGWYSFRQQDLVGHLGFIKHRAKRGPPVVFDWAMRNGSCPKDGAAAPPGYACVSSNTYCVDAINGPGYTCNCSHGYEGNPHLPQGCQVSNPFRGENVELLMGSSFPRWKTGIESSLGCNGLHYALREEKPVAPTQGVAGYEELKKTYDTKLEKWENSNHIALLVMNASISPDIASALPKKDTVKEFLAIVEEQFKGSEKIYAHELFTQLLEKYTVTGKDDVRRHILRKVNAFQKLKALKCELSENLLIIMILESLPAEFDQFKINYNSLKDKWQLSEMTPRIVHEEERIIKQIKDQALQVGSLEGKNDWNGHPKKKQFQANVPLKGKGSTSTSSDPDTSAGVGSYTCNFCKQEGHYRNDFPTWLKWLHKTEIPYNPNHRAGKRKLK